MSGVNSSRPLHILYTSKVSPRLGGGAEARTYEIGKRLVQKGHRITVVAGKTETHMPDMETVEGMTVYNLSSVPEPLLRRLGTRTRYYWSRYLYYYPTSIRWLRRWLEQEQVDIWRDDISPFPVVGAAALAHEKQIPLIATVHSLSGTWRKWCSNYGLSAGTAGYLSEVWIRRTKPYTRVISVSKWLEEALAQTLGAGKVTWIPNGVDSKLFHPRPGLEERPYVTLLYVARFVALKDHPALIEAFSEVFKQEPHVRLVLVGDGPDKEQCLRQVAEKELQHAVTFTDRVAKADMPALYREADVYVSTSHIEGQPLTFIEAMASGLPLVSTNIPAVQGVLDQTNSLLFEPGSVSALAEALLTFIRDSELRRTLGGNARRLVEGRFDWNHIADEELQVYASARELLAGKRSSAHAGRRQLKP